MSNVNLLELPLETTAYDPFPASIKKEGRLYAIAFDMDIESLRKQ